MAKSPLFGRRIHIAGSVPDDVTVAPISEVEQARELVQGLVKELLNAAFNWSFVNYYFHKYVGENPFGFAASDIKAYYMGATGCAWSETRSSRLSADLKPQRQGDHTALRDAQYQAELFRLIRARVPLRGPTSS